MRKLLSFMYSLLIVGLISQVAQANISVTTEYDCKDHQNTLRLEAFGAEHVNHQLFLNGSIYVSEVSEGLWFIETIECTKDGFELTVSHKQYADPEKTVFKLSAINNGTYVVLKAQ